MLAYTVGFSMPSYVRSHEAVAKRTKAVEILFTSENCLREAESWEKLVEKPDRWQQFINL